MNRKLTEIMEDFISEANGHLEVMKSSMAQNAHAAESFFKSAMTNAEKWEYKVQESFKSVANGAKVRSKLLEETDITALTPIQDIDTAMKAVLTSSSDVTQMMKSFIKVVFEGTASVANEHEKALDFTTNRFENHMTSVHNIAEETEGKLGEIKALVVVSLRFIFIIDTDVL